MAHIAFQSNFWNGFHSASIPYPTVTTFGIRSQIGRPPTLRKRGDGECGGSGNARKVLSLRSSFLSQNFAVRNNVGLRLAPMGLGMAPLRNRVERRPLIRADAGSFLSALPDTGPIRDAFFTSIGAVSGLLIAGFAAWFWHREDRRVKEAAAERGEAAMPEVQAAAGQKESVEWVNMVLHKIWKVYRRSLEAWLVGLLQPAIDKLPKPDYVTRVEIAEFSLDMEPISVRNVQRRASRRVNDIQYHVGLRYSGGARCLIVLHLSKAGVVTKIPVGVHDLDVDAEMWVKLRLAPISPYVGTLSIAFVRLPTIKLVLAPFRMLNLFSIPFLSRFLSKLLTVDLPRLLVLPRHITFDFLPHNEEQRMASSVVLDLLKSETFSGLAEDANPGDAFVGELSVTLCEARNLPGWFFSGWSDPYCDLVIGEQRSESKRNSETSHPAGPRDPVWNQDFLFWVEDPVGQKLVLNVRDSAMTLKPNLGFVEFPVWQLKDCVPVSMWLPLQQETPFGVKKLQGEIRLLLTYKSYVDENDYNPDIAPYIRVFSDSDSDSDKDQKAKSTDQSDSLSPTNADDSNNDSSTSEGESSENKMKEFAWGAAMWTIAEISKWLDNVSKIREEEKRNAQLEKDRGKNKKEVALVLYKKEIEKENLVSTSKIEEILEEERRKSLSTAAEPMNSTIAALPEGKPKRKGFRHGVATTFGWIVNQTVNVAVGTWNFVVPKGEEESTTEDTANDEDVKSHENRERKKNDGSDDDESNGNGGIGKQNIHSNIGSPNETELHHMSEGVVNRVDLSSTHIAEHRNVNIRENSNNNYSSNNGPLSPAETIEPELLINGVLSNFSSFDSISPLSHSTPSSSVSAISPPSFSTSPPSPPIHTFLPISIYPGDFINQPSMSSEKGTENERKEEANSILDKSMAIDDVNLLKGELKELDNYYKVNDFTDEELANIRGIFHPRP